MKKKDYIYIFLCSLFVLLIYVVFSHNQIYGSSLDWGNQHFFIPEYFRTLFYETKDLFPDFAFNLGGGQNIYYFAYYGFLSPVIIFSYLFPFIAMMDYLIISEVILTILSVYLFYIFLKRNNYQSRTCFLATFIYITAAPILFHTHRHIMFVNYMPFVLLALLEIDKYVETKRRAPLMISIFLIIMTSYFFSFSALIMLTIYGIYKYTQKNKIKINAFLKESFNFLLPFLGAILLSSILLLPVIYTLLNGRTLSEVPNLISYLIPNFNFNYLLYGSYTMGLTAISVVGLINSLKKGNKYRFLSIALFIMLSFPIINYILNGTLYLNGKTFIPFIPLIILLIAELVETKKIDFKFIFLIFIFLTTFNLIFGQLNSLKFYVDFYFMLLLLFFSLKYKKLLYLLIPFLIIFSFYTNNTDKYVMSDKYKNKTNEAINKLVEDITKTDTSFYRIGVTIDSLTNANNIYNINYNTLTLYSSTYNKYYNNMYFDVFNNNIEYRNKSITSQNTNKLFNDYMSVKYLISDKILTSGYTLISKSSDVYLYESDNVYPLGYVTYNYTNKLDYEALNYPYNVYSLVTSAVSETEETNIKNNIKILTKEFNVLSKDFEYSFKNKTYKFDLKTNAKMTIETNTKKEAILFIRFKMNYEEKCTNDDTFITINGVTNKLTCSSWKYKNNNYIFDYVLYENTNLLNIEFNKGKYEIKDIEFYTLDKNQIFKNIIPLKITEANTKNYVLKGNISLEKNAYFLLNIPYDKGFKILVDDKKITIEKANEGLIGFNLEKGNHEIKVKYNSPYKQIGIICSIIGLVLLMYLRKEDKNYGKNLNNSTLL